MAPESGASPPNDPGALLPRHTTRRACEYCRNRKIRCDKNSPCSNCRRAQTECRVTPRTPHPKRARVLISSQYEKKIDGLDERLEKVAQLVERLGAQEGSASTHGPPTSSLSNPSLGPSEDCSPISTRATTDDDSTPSGQPDRLRTLMPKDVSSAISEEDSRTLIQGESSLSVQSSFAKDFLTNSISPNQECDFGNEMNEELTSLRQIVDAFKRTPLSHELACRHAMPTQPSRRDDYKLPPIEATVACIRRSQDHFWCQGFNTLLTSGSLSDLCLKVYFSDQYTDAEFIILNAALLLFSFDAETGGTEDEPRRGEDGEDGEDLGFHSLCQRNLETAISRLSLLPPVTHDTVLALVMSAGYAIDISKPSLAWRLTSTASHISCLLGFHTRSEGAEKSTNTLNKHGRVFWILYLFEKHLSLRLGYSSTIQDRDITVPLPAAPQLSATTPMQYWQNLVKLANIAGRIYENLYSPSSMCLGAEERNSRAITLAQEMQQNIVESERLCETWFRSIESHQKQIVKYTFLADGVMRQSMITIIHRAVPAQPGSGKAFTDECINSARVTLESHEACVATIIDDPLYLNIYFQWTILFAPFIPFIVLFCHVVATGDKNDLARMQSFVASIRAAGENCTAVSKLHRLFDVFCSVARRYNDVRPAINTPQQEEQMRLNSCLTELGLQTEMSQMSHETGGFMSSATSDNNGLTSNGMADWTSQGPPLGNWVSLNQQMMGILGDDEVQFW
ncbi:hypothetical protein F5Y08DRAFT_316942 [Xylaria arbuscula]|nr:hypothetical protein F5Y08DRAFT_316942 [Xylaria arbuscula]